VPPDRRAATVRDGRSRRRRVDAARNNSVGYATGVSWPLGDAGLSHVERPVAVVLADDPCPPGYCSDFGRTCSPKSD
jgi:hypothetical protein